MTTTQPTHQDTSQPSRDCIDVNAVVSYNLRVIRRQRGMTQAQVAAALARYTGHRLPQASISAMERGFDGQRRRRFDAQELYLLSMVFRVPIIYFLLPPPDQDRHLAGSGRPLQDLYAAALGREHPLTALDGRTGPGAGAWPDDDLRWREHRLDEIPDPADIDAAMRLVGAMFALATAGFPSFCRDHRKDDPDA